MRIVLYIVILAILFFVPLERVDVAKLLPIEAVAVYMDEGNVVLETDTEHKGRGADVPQALESLKENTSTVVYLDTAKFLILSEDARLHLNALRSYLKPSVKVCIGDARGQVKNVAKYLDVHGDLPMLEDLKR